MIQFNLLPDVKLEYIKAERTKHLVISVATLAGVIAFAIFVLLLVTVDGLQKKNLSDLNRDIKTASSKVEDTQDLDKILTVQNQLSALTSLHDSKPAASRLFDYLTQVTPSNVTIKSVSVDFTQNTMSLSGNADTIDAVNTFVDTLKFTQYTTDASGSAATKAFSNVVLASFSTSSSGATYSITLNNDPTIFNNNDNVTLNVPNTVTTRSVTEQPNVLFKDTGTSK